MQVCFWADSPSTEAVRIVGDHGMSYDRAGCDQFHTLQTSLRRACISPGVELLELREKACCRRVGLGPSCKLLLA